MAFGRQMASLKELKQSLAKGGGGQWIKYIPKNGEMNVRFLTEPEGWVNYVEHYDQVLRKSYPCNGMGSCPGCQQGERKTSRYLASVVDLDADEGKGRAVPLQMPKDLANRIVVKYEKWGTIMDRDIELSRSGEGLDTIYDLDADMPSRRKLAQFQVFDLEKILQDAWDDAFGAGTSDPEPEKKAAKKAAGKVAARKRSAAAAVLADDDDDDEDEDDEPTPAPRARAARKRSAAAAVVEEDDDEDDEPVKVKPKSTRKRAAAPPPEPDFEEDDDDEDDDESDEPDADDEAVEYTIAELEAMKLGQLRKVAKDEFGVDPTGMTKDKIIETIENLPPF